MTVVNFWDIDSSHQQKMFESRLNAFQNLHLLQYQGCHFSVFAVLKTTTCANNENNNKTRQKGTVTLKGCVENITPTLRFIIFLASEFHV